MVHRISNRQRRVAACPSFHRNLAIAPAEIPGSPYRFLPPLFLSSPRVEFAPFISPMSRHAAMVQIRHWVALTLAASTFDGAAQEWTRFRGPNGTGVSSSKTIPTKITSADINWKVELPGTGHSSPVLWGDQIFLTSTGDKAGGISVFC